MGWMFLPLKRYADFQGRSRRMEYWMFMLLQLIITVALWIVMAMYLTPTMVEAGDPEMATEQMGAAMAGGAGIIFLLFGVVYLALLIPTLAVIVRRFHDQDKSGWMILLGLIPGIGGLIVFIFMLLPGTPGPNRYGEDPTTMLP